MCKKKREREKKMKKEAICFNLLDGFISGQKRGCHADASVHQLLRTGKFFIGSEGASTVDATSEPIKTTFLCPKKLVDEASA